MKMSRDAPTRALDSLQGRQVVVMGLARSGRAATRLLLRRGARVIATDLRQAGELDEEVEALRRAGAILELGGHNHADFAEADLVVVSPGVPFERPELETARRAGVPVIAELELGARFVKGPLAAVTGTKGKSTTTAALGAMLVEAGRDVRVGGNIGQPLTGLVEETTERTSFVVETSSFQLEATVDFHPHVAVFLNLSEDHLDRHADFDAYAAAKARVFDNQGSQDWAVINGDDPRVLALARGARARTLRFHPGSGATPPTGDAAFLQAGQARLRRGGHVETLFPTERVQLPGAHLRGDLLAAATAARLMDVPCAAVARAVTRFSGAEHVLEWVALVDGVTYYNDSKASNVDAACKSLEAFDRGSHTQPDADARIHVIVGGHYKGGDFTKLRKAAQGRARQVLAIGEAQQRLVRAFAGGVPVVPCDSLPGAVRRASADARVGDVVLLAPACASFDMFTDYAERGRVFKAEVARLTGALATDGHGRTVHQRES